MAGPIKYTKEVVKEGKRVRWPGREQLLPAIAVVIVIAAFGAIFLSLEDYTAASLINQLKSIFGTKTSTSSSALALLNIFLGGRF